MITAPWIRSRSLALAAVVALTGVTVAHADSGPAHQTRQERSVLLGTSGGNLNDFEKGFCYCGTLGALVQKDGDRYILSNNHVLARTNKASLGEDIVQPGLIDVRCKKTAADVVADLSQSEPLQFKNKRAFPLNRVDAAIAQVRTGAVDPAGAVLDIGVLSSTPATDTVGCAVQKSGRTTGNTKGEIAAVDVTVDVNYGGGKTARFVDQFLVTPGDFSAGGDSGSAIVRDTTNPRAVGLLFAGSSSYTIGNPIGAVLSAMEATMVGSSADGGDCPAAATEATAAKDAKGRHQDALMNLPDVAGVGVGRGPAIEVYLARDNASTRRRVPPALDGVPVRVVVTGAFSAR